MTLFLVGNGFDREHGLKTKYWDFRQFLARRHPDFLITFEAAYGLSPNEEEQSRIDSLWGDFETKLSGINVEQIIDAVRDIDMGVDPPGIGIEDTLREYFDKDYL